MFICKMCAFKIVCILHLVERRAKMQQINHQKNATKIKKKIAIICSKRHVCWAISLILRQTTLTQRQRFLAHAFKNDILFACAGKRGLFLLCAAYQYLIQGFSN